jgi:integrase
MPAVREVVCDKKADQGLLLHRLPRSMVGEKAKNAGRPPKREVAHAKVPRAPPARITAREETKMKTSVKKLPRGVFVGKDGHYWICYYVQGRRHREHVGPFLEPAKRAIEKRRTERVENKFFPESMRWKPHTVCFGEIAASYLKLAKARKRTWWGDEDHLQALKSLNDVPLEEITPACLEGVLAELAAERQWSAATPNRYRSTLSAVFEHAIAAGKLEWNPARRIKKRPENNTRVRFLSAEEEEALLGVIRARWPQREAELMVAIHAGLRRSELFATYEVPDGGLRWEWVNLRTGLISLPRTKPHKSRHIPLNSLLRRTFASIPRILSVPYVFETTDPNKWFTKACKLAGLENLHWHDLRHTFGSRLVMDGVPLRAVAELMGHSQITTTQRYAHLAPGYLADAVERLVTPKAAAEQPPQQPPAVAVSNRKP